MKKILLIFTREYMVRVRKKSFLITTILLPLAIMILYSGMIALVVSDKMKEKEERISVLVSDRAGLLDEKGRYKSKSIFLQLDSAGSLQEILARYRDKKFDACLYIPPFATDSPGTFIIHSEGPLSMAATSDLEDMLNDAIVSKRLQDLGMTKEKYRSIQSDITVDYRIDSDSGKESEVTVPEVGYIVSYACGFLIYLMMLIYGTQVMRGVMEEKISRISEIMVSSVKPFQLMMGKILGIGAVGLTQFLIWIILIFALQSSVSLFIPDIKSTLSAASAGADTEGLPAAGKVLAGISSLPLLKILFSFMFYFLFGYLTYAAIFAAIGSAVSDDQQDAQQLLLPVMMPILFGFIILSNAIDDPYSDLAIFGSYFPLTSPIVMMGRITFDIPAWELGISMLLLAGCFVLITWIAARIYRVGILMYGKKPGWKELIRWGFRK